MQAAVITDRHTATEQPGGIDVPAVFRYARHVLWQDRPAQENVCSDLHSGTEIKYQY